MALMSSGYEHSATFRELVETIDGTNGLVYIERGPCGHGVKACLVFSMTLAGPNRVLHILVDSPKTDCRVIERAAHEWPRR